ncbi:MULTISPECIES: BBE domain-containing protein [unclassified Streptomyces]|uniref:BBE domain-containing protein n=1 Tax=unclassified Streptomyces TaxID=2593676 RepID=UPI0033DFE3C9
MDSRDADLSAPAFNPLANGRPWHRLYRHDNYGRLQRTKTHRDPRNAFRHRQSIRPTGPR